VIIKPSARTVIFDDNNLFAIIDVKDSEYFKIPGGGIEEGESPIQAAIREAKEESGCEIKIIKKIGDNKIINRPQNIIYYSVCFLAKKIKQNSEPNFDDWERQNKMKIIWVNIKQAISLFEKARPVDYISKKINQRDLSFILKAKNILNL
jgi:ADP-ribose pyrophosphatase YjhB (NUDIX family)